MTKQLAMSVFFPDEVGGGSKKGKNVEDAEADGWGFLGEVATHKSKEEKKRARGFIYNFG